MHVLGTGCQSLPAGHSKNAPKGAALPKDLPLRSTVNDCFCRWNHDGTLDRIQYALYDRCREMAGRNSSPTAAIIPSR